MKDINIREAKEADYKQLMELYNGFVGEVRYSGDDQDSFKEALASPNNYIYVAIDKSKLVGFVTFSVRTVVRYPKPIAEMDEFYVLPDYRRRGLGTRLMETVLNKAAELGCYRMFIETHYQHKPAQKLYEKMKFTNYGYHFIKDL